MAASLTIIELAKKVIELREKQDEIRHAKKEIDIQTKTAEMNLYNQMTVENCKSIRLKGIGLFSQSFRPFPTIINIEKATVFLKQIGVYDEIMQISDDDAIQTARKLARQEGLLVGISSGAAMAAAIKIANKNNTN